jgi:hypothetical protein
MNTTDHTVRPLAQTGAIRVAVNHDRNDGFEYEFYIPAAIWDHPSTKTFITRLSSIVPGTTVFKGAQGIWKDQAEDTHILRLLVRASFSEVTNTMTTIEGEVGILMAELSTWSVSRQETVLFTVRQVTMSESSMA